MATPEAEKIRKKYEQQAEQRINPLLKGLTMLTGGLAGEFTGTNEQIRQRNLAKRALMEEDLAALQEQRLNERMKAQRGQMLEDELKRIAAQDEAITRRQREGEAVAREAKRPAMVGYLRTRPDYQAGGPMAMPIPALESMDTLEESVAMEKARQDQEEEARRIKSGYMSYNIPGRGTIGGTPEQIEAMAEKDPVLKKFISQAPSEEPPFSTTWGINPFTYRPEAKLTFSKSVPYEEQKRLVEQFMGQSGSNPFSGEPASGAPSAKKDEKPTNIPGYYVRLKQ
jgi:hypothetical protein